MQPTNVLPFQTDLRPHTILVVDDEDGVRKLLSAWVASLGYTVRAAANANEALAAMREGPVHAAICDILMPGHDGVWLIDQLRHEYPDTAIIIATGLSDMNPAVTLQSGIAGYLVKPFQLQDLRAVLENALAPDSPWTRSLGRIRGPRRLPEI